MSLTLYISSYKCQFISKKELFDLVKKFECQIYKTINNVLTNNKFVQECGFCLKFFNINDDQFKNEVWIKLKEKLGLVCAFVSKKGDYSGCVLNWPNVFRHSLCSKL